MRFDEYCKCRCHSEGLHIEHIVACCTTCSGCHRRIRMSNYDEHHEKCLDKFDPKINTVRLSELLKAVGTLQQADLDVSGIGLQVNKLLKEKLSKIT